MCYYHLSLALPVLYLKRYQECKIKSQQLYFPDDKLTWVISIKMIPHNHIFLMWSSCIYEWKIKLFTILALRFCFSSLLTTQLFIEPHVCLHRLLNLRILSQHSDSWCWYEFFLLKHFGCDHGHLYSNSNIGKEN